MEVLSQVQSVVVENAFVLGAALLVAILLAGLAWYWLSQSNKSTVLENQARINSATTAEQDHEHQPHEQNEQTEQGHTQPPETHDD